MNPDFLKRLAPLYNRYNEVIKPLIAEIEVRFESFPTSIFNEIRAFNDHISRCYLKPDDDSWVNVQINKAEGHIERMVLDCYKFLNVSLYNSVIKKFDKEYKGVDLSNINNGDFLIQHKKIAREIVVRLKEAKSKEVLEDKSESIAIYEEVHNKYTELEDLIEQNCRNLFWAKSKFYVNKVWKVILWLASTIVSGIVSTCLLPYDEFVNWIKSIFVN